MFEILKSFCFNSDYILTDIQSNLLCLGSILFAFVFVFILIQLFYKILHSIF